MLSLMAPLALALVLIAPGKQAPVEEKWLDFFRPYPGARRLCQQHVSGNSMHITWTAYATTASLDQVAKFYAKHEGGPPVREGDGLKLEGPDDALLTAHVKGTDYPTCGVDPTKEEKTVLILSKASRSKR